MYPQPDVSKFTEPPVEFVGEVEGISIRSTLLEKAGDCVGQHAHSYSHATLVGSGRVRMWADGVWAGDYKRAEVIAVKAGVVHIFEAQEDNTFMSCLTISEIAEMVRKEAV
jgi:quercetin dioxygenase-like cupin family protein